MGPFVDATDGVTPETGVTLGGADQAEVLKANGAATSAMAGTFAAVSGADGWYDYTVGTGDVDTVGEVVFVVQDSSVCLPVMVRAQVVEEAIYDALFAGSAAAFDANQRVDVGEWLGNVVTFGTGGPDVNINAISDDTTAASNMESAFDGTGYDVGGIDVSELNTAVDAIGSDGTGLTEAGGTGDQLTAVASAANLATVDANVDTMVLGIITGAAATGTLSVTQCTSDLTGYANDQLIGRVITFTSGDAEGESTDITDYAATGGLISYTAITTAPANGDTFKIT